LSAFEKRIVVRSDMGTGQLYLEHFSKAGEVTTPSIGDRQVTEAKVASGVVARITLFG